MAHVLEMAARKLGDPVAFLVPMESRDRLAHRRYFSTISTR